MTYTVIVEDAATALDGTVYRKLLVEAGKSVKITSKGVLEFYGSEGLVAAFTQWKWFFQGEVVKEPIRTPLSKVG